MQTPSTSPEVFKLSDADLADPDDLRSALAYRHAKAYFQGCDGHRPYAGAAFETTGHAWSEDRTLDVITPSDLLALGTLSTPLSKYTIQDLLAPEFQKTAGDLLARIDPDTSIVSDEGRALLGEGGDAWQLYSAIRSISGMGPTRTSKLLARKRPALIPIRDSFVEKALGATRDTQWWERMREYVSAPSPVGPSPWIIAERIHEVLGLPTLVTPLRVIDAVLWRSVESPDGAGVDTEDASI